MMNDEENTDLISPNDILTTICNTTRAIFRHLPIRSIDSCSLVCQSWADLARQIESSRLNIHTFAYKANSCDLHEFNELFCSFINNKLWSIPLLAIVVVTKDFGKDKLILSSTENARRSTGQQTIKQNQYVDTYQILTPYLNKSCRLLTIISCGIIMTNDQYQTKEIELYENGLSMLLLPKFPSNIFQIYPFKISSKHEIPTDLSRSDLHKLLGEIPDDVPIRCVIFFAVHHQIQVRDCIENLLKHYPSNIVFAGGFAIQTKYDNQEQSMDTCGIVLTGNENHLNIQQIILGHDIQTTEQIQAKLKQMKINEISSKFSFAFQISCISRGSHYYGNNDVECSQFRKIFPRTPLIGIFANGEIGHDYPSNEQIQNANDLFLCYSTVFTLISIKDIGG